MAALDLLQGTLDLLILRTLSWGPMHGYSVARLIRERGGTANQPITPRPPYHPVSLSVLAGLED